MTKCGASMGKGVAGEGQPLAAGLLGLGGGDVAVPSHQPEHDRLPALRGFGILDGVVRRR